MTKRKPSLESNVNQRSSKQKISRNLRNLPHDVRANDRALELLVPESDSDSSMDESVEPDKRDEPKPEPKLDEPEPTPDEQIEEEESSDDDIEWNDLDLLVPTEEQEYTSVEAAETVVNISKSESILISPEQYEKELKRQRLASANRQKLIRLTCHILHMQSLLYYGSIRNEWINDTKLQRQLRQKLPKPLRSAFKKNAKHIENGKNLRKPDEQIDNLSLLVIKLAVYFRKIFKITEPGLVVNGYTENQISPLSSIEMMMQCSMREKFNDIDEFRQAAIKFRGSRDFGAQVFTCLLRSLGVETRLIFSPPLLGYTLTKLDSFIPTRGGSTQTAESVNVKKRSSRSAEIDNDGDVYVPKVSKIVDSQLAYPIFWSEVYDPMSKAFIPIDALVLPMPSYEEINVANMKKPSEFEPQAPFNGAVQKMYYVIGYEDDMNCKDLSPKYMNEKKLPQVLNSNIMITALKSTAAASFREVAYLVYLRSIWLMSKRDKSTEALRLEDAQIKKWLTTGQNNAESSSSYPTVLSAYKSHPYLILESMLNKSQALLPDAKPVHSFTVKTSKGTRTETVFLLKDVVNCRPETAWYKEGRVIKPGEKPLKMEKAKPSTRNGKRKLESNIKYGNTEENSTEQGLFSYKQTMLYIPPEIRNGEPLPRNEFGRLEVFTPNMVPKGTVHLHHPGLGRIAKTLGIDYVPAVVGFRFQSRYAKPDIDGGIVANQNVEVLLDAWRSEQANKKDQQDTIKKADALARWKLYLARIQLLNRLKRTYGGE